MCGDKYEPQPIYVSLQEYLEKIIDLRFGAMESQIAEARRLMEKTMDGFPEQFLKIGAFEPVKAEIKALVKNIDQMEGKASAKSLEMVRWVSLTAVILGILGIVLRFLKV